jgi:hypothetical protein
MSCGGGHLGFPIGIKKQKLCRGSSNDHSWAVWFQFSEWFQKRTVLKHFSHSRLFEICFHFAGHRSSTQEFSAGPSEFLPDLHFLCKIVLKPSNVMPLLLF